MTHFIDLKVANEHTYPHACLVGVTKGSYERWTLVQPWDR